MPEPEAPARYAERPAGQAGVYGTAQAAGHGPVGGYGGERAAGHGGDRPPGGSAGVYGSPGSREQDNRSGDPAARPPGVVRHTETVHVTTRHTVVDGGGGESGNRYGGYVQPWSAQQPEERGRDGRGTDRDDRSRSHADERRSWSGSARDDERSWAGAARDDRDWETPPDDRGWDGAARQWEGAAEPAPAGPEHRVDDTGQYWAQLRAGDRWAAVRDDDRGRELRIGERRAEVHADPGGTEYRMEDRWASMRRDEPRRGAHGDEPWRDSWGEPEDRAALPAGGVPVPEEWRPPRQRGYQPEPAHGYEPEPVHGYQAEPGYGYQAEPAHGYQAEPVRGRRPEAYGRRHQVEEPDYGYPTHDGGANRWR
ncbi:hypothetical protein KIF24_01450 [Micromonospora sp. Llam7]|uniref:hypothetical protein n=1 Tax=Micromonospora tarapacensis TaxID=2835305 RepID=UPI001C83D105|nr:hypothetical protein [Micromonospora tarapacensis]MBX7264850.1 hypothetical protein [Micromonospora tarapacensis]